MEVATVVAAKEARVRDRRTTDEVAQRYAAHRLELVRLAVLLTDDRPAADAVVQAAFLRYLRRGDARRDPGAGLADLRVLVVAGCRAAAPPPAGDATAAGRTDPLDPLAGLPAPQREVLVLAGWAGLGTRQAAVVLQTTETAVRDRAARLEESLARVGVTSERAVEMLRRRADAVSAGDLRGFWGDVAAEDARRSARTHRAWRAAAGVVAAVAAVVSVAALAGGRDGAVVPLPAPTTSESGVPAGTEPLSSPALAPGEQPRAAIPWGDVTAGWVVVATSAPPTAVTTTLLLVSPSGTRYALGTAPAAIVVQDVSADGTHVLVAVGSQASEWDVQAGTSRPLGVAYGWKSMRYAGRPDRGYLVLRTDASSAVQIDHWSPDGRVVAEYPLTLPPTAGSPGTPGLVVDPSGRQAVVANRDGVLVSIDLASDAVGVLPLPDGAAGCSPRSSWSTGQVLVACSLGGRRLFVVPLDGSAARPLGDGGLADAWPVSAQAALVRRGDPCSTALSTLNGTGGLSAWAPPPGAGDLVPNAVARGRLYFGGTRCPSDGSRLVAYDLTAGQTTELVGEDAGGRTVRQAVVLPPRP
ncbi:MAG: hypothetical protein ABIW80_04490 [Lapillicoccus sp.]